MRKTDCSYYRGESLNGFPGEDRQGKLSKTSSVRILGFIAKQTSEEIGGQRDMSHER